MLDKEASLNKETGATHIMKDGVISKTKNTPIQIVGEDRLAKNVQKLGERTVPYWSLQHYQAWWPVCNVVVHVLDSAKHKEISNKKKFHDILLDILKPMERAVVY